MSARRYFVIFILILVLCLCVLCYINSGSVFKIRPELKEEIVSFSELQNNNNQSWKLILYWNTFFGQNDFYFGEGPISLHCPRYNNCYATHRRSLEHVEKVDAIVFHGINEQLNHTDLPLKRHSKQKYIFVSMESPINRYIKHEFDEYFNLTMTYQLNSDIIWTYADVIEKDTGNVVVPSRTSIKWKQYGAGHEKQEDERINSIIKGKRKLAVWYRSNCETRSGRENYVRELDKHVTVAKFGACSQNDIGCSRDKDCFKIDVEPNYFFYLSFENSLCDDYVTEKLFHALNYYVVPVVYGGANYSKFVPPNSYINALDFDSPKDLAKYLTGLTENITEYKKYFEWKNKYRINSPTKRVICDLCEVINGVHTNSYKISQWYSAERCSIQQQLDKQIANEGANYATKATVTNH